MNASRLNSTLVGAALLILGVGLAYGIRHRTARHGFSDSPADIDPQSLAETSVVPAPPTFAGPSLPATEPQSDRALVARVQALAEAKPQEAAPALKQVVEETQDRAALTIAASVAARLPPEEANPILSTIIAKGNAPSYAYQQLAQNLAAKGESQEAGGVYEEGLKKNPAEFSLREAYARYLVTLGRPREAADLCLKDIETGNATRPNSMRRLILAGEILWNAGNQDQARTIWQKLMVMAETEQEGRRYYEQVLAQYNAR